MRTCRFPRYPIERIEADWSRIDSLIAARDRADRISALLMHWALPALLAVLSLAILCRS
ncbi:hypothetical protein SAMN05892877_111239 [Rhizobium subbaraonis]|uniref:Uncharacterized protein n=1 Tax=Rhizobium subbaraonis TaxID=908946 RepID=A0A285UPY5_9HYPH|nr:hypothetical protein [Rhizobium subbaraonis]SOC43813.1 hypothetical protein SAMN05892877_111239 [Rhizobium subbaraonis]